MVLAGESLMVKSDSFLLFLSKILEGYPWNWIVFSDFLPCNWHIDV
jgi:hypothetical protein